MGFISSKILPKSETQKEREFLQTIDTFITETRAILNGGISFVDNVNCKLITFTSSATPDAENTIAHTLGKIPSGYIVYNQNKAGSLYNGTTTFTTTNIYLKCSVASVTYKIIVF